MDRNKHSYYYCAHIVYSYDRINSVVGKIRLRVGFEILMMC